MPSCSAVAAANSAITSAAGTQAGAFRLKDGAPLFGPVACSEPVCSAAGGVEAENDEEGSLTLQLDAPTREQKSKIQRMAQ